MQRGTGEREVRLAEPLVARPDEVHGLSCQLEGVLQATLDEAGGPQPHHGCDHPCGQVELVSEVDRPLARLPDERRGVAVERVQRWYRHLEQGEFSLVSITAVRHGGEKLAGGGQEADRVAVSEHRGRHFCRALEVPQRTLGVSRQPILLGDLRRNGVGMPGPEQFECLGEPAVQQPTPCWGDSVVCRATQQIVGEVVAIPDLAE